LSVDFTGLAKLTNIALAAYFIIFRSIWYFRVNQSRLREDFLSWF